ncbi:hypothetical protein ACFPOE_14130 [Caenimonas terrae]|uniref:MarR family transcriptional regulator n=1 Tax=Caenimonas terrae TaxID=696074 RepID=A0ABW0NEC2_9BURK
MSIELPVLRLGLAGFAARQVAELDALLRRSAPGRHVWQIGHFGDSDAWWLSGPRTQRITDGTIRILPAIPSERSLQIDLQEVDRPVGFSLPTVFTPPNSSYTFDPESIPSINAVLEKFEGWLQPVAAQFSLAARIIEQESVLGSGMYHVILNARLLAVVDMKGDIGVFPSAGPADFDDAMWVRQPERTEIPDSFVRTTLSELMWQYAVRTTRDVLPKRYRSGLLYFRRPPRLQQRLLSDGHMLLMRELSAAAGTFAELQQRTGMAAPAMAKALAALYLVGTITSNPKRASVTRTVPGGDDSEPSQGIQHSIVPSGLETESMPSTQPPRMRPGARHGSADFTLPMPLVRR